MEFFWLVPPSLTPQAEDLLDYMAWYSEYWHCAHWQGDLEHRLWEGISGEHALWREGHWLLAKEHRRLQALAARSDSWFVWDSGNGGPRPVSWDEWERIHAAYQRAQEHARRSAAPPVDLATLLSEMRDARRSRPERSPREGGDPSGA